ncbi:uncharacterized acetyltransferase At3g50280-like [Nymphaea colorata]|nr:uncharacterized acetyltransferase At3g50280-like [Nymphaea colorata]
MYASLRIPHFVSSVRAEKEKEMPAPTVRLISSTMVHLRESSSSHAEGSRRRWELTAWDVAMLSTPYIQKGLLFPMPPGPLYAAIQHLKSSLSRCLLHFPFLAGRLATDLETTTFVDCSDQGVQFDVAAADGVHVSDLASAGEIPAVVNSFFPLADGTVIGFDGYSLPLLAVQVTELSDGVFVGCSFNHVMGDGESFWHFFKSWSEITSGSEIISRAPLTERPPIHHECGRIRFLVSEEHMARFSSPPLRVRFFRFSRNAIVCLKAKANRQLRPEVGDISSLQALTALMWRCITRARRLPVDQTTTCKMAIGNRTRLDPPLPAGYFGNCMEAIAVKAVVGELLAQELGWAARALHDRIKGHTNLSARKFVEEWVKRPSVYHGLFEGNGVMVGSSPRYEIYGIDFGWGSGVTVLSGAANKYDGKMSAYRGKGGIDLEVCLFPHFMSALESDGELLDMLSIV